MLEVNLSDCRFQVPQESKAMELVLPCGLRKSKPTRDMLFLSLFASHLLSGSSHTYLRGDANTLQAPPQPTKDLLSAHMTHTS